MTDFMPKKYPKDNSLKKIMNKKFSKVRDTTTDLTEIKRIIRENCNFLPVS